MAQTQLPNAISALIDQIFGGMTHPLAREVAGWMNASKRFRVFTETYRDKIRKKVRNIHSREGLLDVRGELALAYLLLQEPRFAVQYELQSASKQRAPDFTVIFRDNLLFHVEVTRLHAGQRDAASASHREDTRLANTLCGKLGQMQPGAINVLALLTEDESYQEADIVATTRALLMRASNKDEAYFTWHGFSDARDFLHRYQRLSGILLITNWQSGANPRALAWENNQAHHPIPGPVLTILRRIVT